MFQPAPGFRISLSAEEEWSAGRGFPGLGLQEVVAAAFAGKAEVITEPRRIRPGSNIWTMLIGVSKCQAELRVRCDSQGRWKGVLEAWATGV